MESTIKTLIEKYTDLTPKTIEKFRNDVNVAFIMKDVHDNKFIAKILGNKDGIDPFKQFELKITQFLQSTEFGTLNSGKMIFFHNHELSIVHFIDNLPQTKSDFLKQDLRVWYMRKQAQFNSLDIASLGAVD